MKKDGMSQGSSHANQGEQSSFQIIWGFSKVLDALLV